MIFGIGVALSLERWGTPMGIRGLGLGGTIVINLCGGGTLLSWLIVGNLDLPLRGLLTLWIVAILVIGIGLVKLISKSWQQHD